MNIDAYRIKNDEIEIVIGNNVYQVTKEEADILCKLLQSMVEL